MTKKFRRFIQVGAVVTVLSAAGATVALASSSDHDHDRAKTTLQAGEIQPLVEILQQVTPEKSARVLEVELKRKRNRWVYEIKFIEQNGMVQELKVDAKTAQVLESEYDDDHDDD